MKTPSLWKQIHDENASFVDQFKLETDYVKAGLTEADNKLVAEKRASNRLHGVTLALSVWQVRFSLNGKQEILFVCRSLSVAALMRDLMLTMLLRYPHCHNRPPGNPLAIDPTKENGIFNLPLSVRKGYAENVTETTFPLLNFLERVEKILLDRGILHPLSPEEIAAREQLASQAKTHADSTAQKRYQKRRSTQLDEIFGQIESVADTCKKMDELRARLCDWVDRKDAALDTVSQQVEFMTGQFESLKQAVEKNTATFQRLIDEARNHASHKPKNT